MARTTGKIWTHQEIDLLIARYANERNSDLGAELGCPANSVYWQARKLGLKKSAEHLLELSKEAGKPGSVATHTGIKHVEQVVGGTVTVHRMRR